MSFAFSSRTIGKLIRDIDAAYTDAASARCCSRPEIAFITDPVEVGAYDRRFKQLENASVCGDEARAVFAGVADDYRALGESARCREQPGRDQAHPRRLEGWVTGE